MSNRNIAVLSLKVLALYSGQRLFDYVQMAFFQIATAPTSEVAGFSRVFIIIGAIMPIIFLVVFALAIWYFADWLASKITKDGNNSEDEETVIHEDVAVIAVTVVGLYFVVHALTGIASTFFSYWLVEKASAFSQGLSATYKVKLFTDLFQLSIGIILMLGSTGLVGLLGALRTAGTTKITREE